MKQLITIILILLGSVMYSQIDLECDYREFCTYDEPSNTWSNCVNDKEVSVFKFNKAETIFIHYVNNKSRTYYVTSTSHEEGDGKFTYYVTTTSNDNYVVQINLDERIIRIKRDLYLKREDTYILRYYISGIVDY